MSHVPPAQDGSNYYVARDRNKAYGLSGLSGVAYGGGGGGGCTVTSLDTNQNVWSHIAVTQQQQQTNLYLNGVYTTGGYTRSPGTVSGQTWGGATYTFTDEAMEPIFESAEDRIKWQQDMYIEPRDHMYTSPIVVGGCVLCPRHNIHRLDPSKHMSVIDEEPDYSDWLDLLAS